MRIKDSRGAVGLGNQKVIFQAICHSFHIRSSQFPVPSCHFGHLIPQINVHRPRPKMYFGGLQSKFPLKLGTQPDKKTKNCPVGAGRLGQKYVSFRTRNGGENLWQFSPQITQLPSISSWVCFAPLWQLHT